MKLKEIIGSDVFKTLPEETRKKYEKMDLEDVSTGEYVPRERLDTEIEKVKDYREKLVEKDNKIKELEKVDPAKLQETIENLNKEMEANNKEFEKKLKQKDFDYALNTALSNYNCRNKKIVAQQLDYSKLHQNGEEILGLNEQIEALKKTDSYLFDDPKVNTGKIETKKNFFGGSVDEKGEDSISNFFINLGKKEAETMKNSGLQLNK